MRFLHNIQPRYILAVTGAVALLMIVSALVELRQSRDELLQLMREDAFSLVEAVERSATNNLLSSVQAEEMLAERLFNNAFYLMHLDSLGRLTPRDLTLFAEANNLFRIHVFDAEGRRVMSNFQPDPAHAALRQRSPRSQEEIAPILRGETDRVVIGFREARIANQQRYAVAVRRARRGGAIVINLNADQLLEFRRSVGIGRLISDLGNNNGLAYVALQDTVGILAASGAVEELSAIAADSFLQSALARESTMTRLTPFGSVDVFEVVRPFVFEQSTVGLFRIGLHMHEIQAAEKRMQRRIAIMSLVIIVLGVLAVTVIMTSQAARLTEQQYVRVQAFSSNILREMQDAVVSLDARGRVSVFNRQAEQMFGISEREILGIRLELLGGEQGSCLRDLFASGRAGAELSLVCPNGVQREVSVALSTTSAGDGSIESTTAVVRDLTEARRLEREIQRREKLSAMGELASGVAHEIRNPMNAIAMIAQRFEAEFAPRKGAKEYKSLTSVLRNEIQRVNQIVRHFLQFARPPALAVQQVALSEFIAQVAMLFKGQASAKGIRFEYVGEEDAIVSVDPGQMTQALLNVLQNALDATPAGGQIRLSCRVDAERVRLAVSDTGTGIPKETIGKIFDLYFSTKREGTGMGLAITQQIVGRHNGSVEVSSTEGKGTEVTLVLPRNRGTGQRN